MPIIEPKGGVTSLGHDSTAGKRGLPRRTKPEGGTTSLPDPEAPAGEPIGSDVRGGTTDGLYERPLRQRTPTTGDGTGQ